MAGTKAGGKKAAETNKKKYGEDYYIVNGAKGGKLGHTGGFYANRDLASSAGAKGGRISRRGRGQGTYRSKLITASTLNTSSSFNSNPE